MTTSEPEQGSKPDETNKDEESIPTPLVSLRAVIEEMEIQSEESSAYLNRGSLTRRSRSPKPT
jgi:hypothetical protein